MWGVGGNCRHNPPTLLNRQTISTDTSKEALIPDFDEGGALCAKGFRTFQEKICVVARVALEIALVVSTYLKPRHLQLSLLSIALQQGVAGQIELVVTDDGSTDETAAIVREFSRAVDFPVGFTTHPRETFQLARCRNEGVAASAAPYIVFVDGDCVLPPDFVLEHLRRRRPGVAMSGDCYRLNAETSARMDAAAIESGMYDRWVSIDERRRLARQSRKAWLYALICHRSKPKLLGGNTGVWRSDLERVNGYDEAFEGWGCEDDDFGMRLRGSGVRIESIVRWTRAYHVWHLPDSTAPARWREGRNVARLLDHDRPTYAACGLRKAGYGAGDGASSDADEPFIIPFPQAARFREFSAGKKAA